MSTTQTTQKAEAHTAEQSVPGSLIYCIQRGWANTECEEMAKGLIESLKELLADIECYCADGVANKAPCPVHKARANLAKAEKGAQ